MIYILAASYVEATAFATRLGVGVRKQNAAAQAVIYPRDVRGRRFRQGDRIYETEQFRLSQFAEDIVREVRARVVMSDARRSIEWWTMGGANLLETYPDWRDPQAVEEWLAS